MRKIIKKNVNLDPHTGYELTYNRNNKGLLKRDYIYFKTDTTTIDIPDSSPYYSITNDSEKTKIYFQPLYSYYLGGGLIKLNQEVLSSEEITFNFIMLPDIPKEQGGQHYFIANKKLNSFSPFYEKEEQETQKLYYNPEAPYLNKILLEIYHNGNQINMEYSLKIFMDV